MTAPTDLPLDEMEAAAKAAMQGRQGTGLCIKAENAFAALCTPPNVIEIVTELRAFRERLKTETQRADDARALVDRLILQAQIWAGEARCANATIHESYQAVTGATGEPGNWNGARPIIEAVQALRERIRVLEAEIADRKKRHEITEQQACDMASDLGARAEAAEQRAREMAEALKPFAHEAQFYAVPRFSDDHPASGCGDDSDIKIGDLRRAAQALKGDAS